MCEDYPCCGHTDGLGCDWVSPNEVVPCDVCIEARRPNPYHNQFDGCPTIRAKAMLEVPEGAICVGCEDEEADIMDGNEPVCMGCYAEGKFYAREMQEQYDDLWHR